jgi:hypothetical protein
MVSSGVVFLDCPAYLDAHGASRCGLPAEVQDRYTVTSTDGPLESVRIQCPRRHWFNGPIESMTWDKQSPSAARPAGSDRVLGTLRRGGDR